MMISNHKENNNPSDLGNSLANHHADGERGLSFKGETMLYVNEKKAESIFEALNGFTDFWNDYVEDGDVRDCQDRSVMTDAREIAKSLFDARNSMLVDD